MGGRSASAAGVFFNTAYSWLQQHGCNRIHDILAIQQHIMGRLEKAALAPAQHVPQAFVSCLAAWAEVDGQAAAAVITAAVQRCFKAVLAYWDDNTVQYERLPQVLAGLGSTRPARQQEAARLAWL
jgi:streptomycin 6-kinase